MKRLFISQPMRDKTDEQIKAERNAAIEAAKNVVSNSSEIEVIDSFFENAPHDAKPLWFLGKSFELLANADIVYFCKDWEKYRGCKMEHEAAKQYLEPNGVRILHYND